MYCTAHVLHFCYRLQDTKMMAIYLSSHEYLIWTYLLAFRVSASADDVKSTLQKGCNCHFISMLDREEQKFYWIIMQKIVYETLLLPCF